VDMGSALAVEATLLPCAVRRNVRAAGRLLLSAPGGYSQVWPAASQAAAASPLQHARQRYLLSLTTQLPMLTPSSMWERRHVRVGRPERLQQRPGGGPAAGTGKHGQRRQACERQQGTVQHLGVCSGPSLRSECPAVQAVPEAW
jgi:hypothetical protein